MTMWQGKGKRLQQSDGKRHVLHAAVMMLYVGAMAIFFTPGIVTQNAWTIVAPQPTPDYVEPIGNEPAKEEQSEVPSIEIPEPQPYDYSQPVSEGRPVDNNYFADAAFVGDSLTDGLLIYSGITGADNLAYKGMTVESAQSKEVQFTGREDKVTALEALSEQVYGKVYVMLGINELGWGGTQRYYDGYNRLLEEIRRLQPEAVIYLQANLPVTESAKQHKAHLDNDTIRKYNEVVRQLAEKHRLYFLDVGKSVADETGALPEDAGIDGVHLTRAYYKKWAEYLKCHVVEEY